MTTAILNESSQNIVDQLIYPYYLDSFIHIGKKSLLYLTFILYMCLVFQWGHRMTS